MAYRAVNCAPTDDCRALR